MLGIVGALMAIPIAGIVQVLVQEWWGWRKEARAIAAGGTTTIEGPRDPEPEP